MNDDDDPLKSLLEDLEKLHEWIMMPFNQIYQLNHLLIWIAKLSHLLLSLMMMISSPKLLKRRMKRAKLIKMMKKVRDQRLLQLMKLKTRWKRCKTFRGEEILSLLLNMESLLVLEQIDTLKQSVVN